MSQDEEGNGKAGVSLPQAPYAADKERVGRKGTGHDDSSAIDAPRKLKKKKQRQAGMLDAAGAARKLKKKKRKQAGASDALSWNKPGGKGHKLEPQSMRELDRYKSRFLNQLILRTRCRVVVEFGCGDGAQLRLAQYPEYHGIDVSTDAIDRCKAAYAGDTSKQFYTIGEIDRLPLADLTLSQDIISHIGNDVDYWRYLKALFLGSRHFVVIYGNDVSSCRSDLQTRLPDFVGDVAKCFPNWRLCEFHRNPYYADKGPDQRHTLSNFFVFERRSEPMLVDGPRSDVAGNGKVPPALMRAVLALRRFRSGEPTVGGNEDGTEAQRDGGALVLTDRLDENRFATAGDAVLVVSRSADSISRTVALENQFICKDVSGFVPDDDLRGNYLFLSKAPRPRLVVSLTTISSRLGTVGKVLRSIADQSVAPDNIILNLSTMPYLLDEGISKEVLPADVRSLVRAGLVEVNWVENTGPYRKLVNAVERFKGQNVVVVTADDDVLLPRDWLYLLVREYQKTGCSVCFRSRLVIETSEGVRPYREWPIVRTETSQAPSRLLIGTGKHGILYHVSHFGDALFDQEFRECAPGADDLFFKVCLMLEGVKTANVHLDRRDKVMLDVKFDSSHEKGPALFDTNSSLNDAKFARLLEFAARKYGFSFAAGGSR